MADLRLGEIPTVTTGMLIRTPAADVFEAFIDPDVTTNFWFTKGSGRLVAGAEVRWEWEMYGTGTTVKVLEFEPCRRIVIEWGGNNGPARVEWTFTEMDAGTYVRITSDGFIGSGDEVVREALDSMQGFSLVLAGAKAYLEHGVRLGLVADHHPPGLAEG